MALTCWLCLLLPLEGRSSSSSPEPLEVVEWVDLTRYVGKWYEIAKYPNRFQRRCISGTTATYSLRGDGGLDVLNQCFRDMEHQRLVRATGRAWVVDEETQARLRVRFFWPFSGAYWVIDLDEDYQYVVVGEPRRRYLWILSRSPQLDSQVYEEILQRLPEKGYDPSLLELTPQWEAEKPETQLTE